MSNTTNVLLVIVIVLLVAIVFGNSADKNVYADGAASSNPIIFSSDSKRNEVFLINTEKSIMLHYKINDGFQLKGARKFDYDVQLDSVFSDSSRGSYVQIKNRIAKQK